jgi:inorganic pyrophosphatase
MPASARGMHAHAATAASAAARIARRYNRALTCCTTTFLRSQSHPMSLDRVPAGFDVPNDCNVVIEIPMHGEPIKYEVDKQTGAVFVDRFMSTAMHYPCNYGYIPQTLSDDGDPCDVLVLSPVPLITGVVVRCRPIGMLRMDDEAGGDAKILAVPIERLSSMYRSIAAPDDLPEVQLAQIAHFFEHYKDLEPGKWVRLAGWAGPDDARREITASVERFRGTAAAHESRAAGDDRADRR